MQKYILEGFDLKKISMSSFPLPVRTRKENVNSVDIWCLNVVFYDTCYLEVEHIRWKPQCFCIVRDKKSKAVDSDVPRLMKSLSGLRMSAFSQPPLILIRYTTIDVMIIHWRFDE